MKVEKFRQMLDDAARLFEGAGSRQKAEALRKLSGALQSSDKQQLAKVVETLAKVRPAFRQ